MPSDARRKPVDAVPWLKVRTQRQRTKQPRWHVWAAGVTSFGVVGGLSLLVVRIVAVLIG